MMMMAAPMVVVTPVVMMVPAMMVVAPIMMVMMVLHLLRPIHSGIRAWICCTTEDVSACRNCRDQQHPNLKQNCQGQRPKEGYWSFHGLLRSVETPPLMRMLSYDG